MPTSTTAMPSPPGKAPKLRDMVPNSCSAMRDFSSITPMRMNKGTAIRVSLLMVPNIRAGNAARKAG